MKSSHSIDPEFSLAGARLAGRSGILELMDDMGRAMTGDPEMRMLGGGNPASVPAFEALVRQRMQEIMAEGDSFERMLLHYDPPQGNPRFIRALAALLQREFGWDIGPRNIAITSGGQSAFFYLFNLLGGRFAGGRAKKILFPLAPEYIGYAGQGIEADLFLSCKPGIEWPKAHQGQRGRCSNMSSILWRWSRRWDAEISERSRPRGHQTPAGTC